MEQRSASLVAIPVSESKLNSLILSVSDRKTYGRPVKAKARKGKLSPWIRRVAKGKK